jgi:AcrR family transcriptional regulator
MDRSGDNSQAEAPPKRRPSLREEHKLVTRARIRRSARICFSRDGIRDVSLEMIALDAGIGRTTLYQYYPTKSDLLLDLMEQSLKAADRVYQKLAQLEVVDVPAVRRWLQAYLAETRDHASSVDMFQYEIENDHRVRQMMRNHWERATAVLGRRFAVFDLTGLSGADLTRRQYQAEAFISEIEQFCGAARLDDYHLDPQQVIDLLAERIVAHLSPSAGA